MLLTQAITKSNLPYSGNHEFIDIINHISESKIPSNCPTRTKIVLNAMKLWSVACKDGKLTCNKESIIESLNEYFIRLNYIINIEMDDSELKDIYWKNSGINMFTQIMNNID